MRKITAEKLLIPDFLNIDFTGSRRDKDIRKFVLKLYDLERIEVLVSLFRYLDSEFNYVVEHNYNFHYHEQFNPNIDFLTLYNPQIKKREFNNDWRDHHLSIDCNLLSRFSYRLEEIQTELNTVLRGIEAAYELNKKIAKVFEGVSASDVQKIWRYYDYLYTECKYNLVEEQIGLGIDNIDAKDILPYNDESLDEIEIDDYNEEDDFYKELLSRIRQRQIQDGRTDIPLFDPVKYRELKSYENSPLISSSKRGQLIASFAGESTPLLTERLKEINFQIKGPIQDPITKAWNYSIDCTSNFLGLIYWELLEFVNDKMQGLGFIPRCGWCKNPINPTGQQMYRLKSKQDIYCLDNFEDCKRKGRTNKQAENRSKKKIYRAKYFTK